MPLINNRGDLIHPVRHFLNGKINQKNGVFGYNPHQNADQHRHRIGIACKNKPDRHAANRDGQRKKMVKGWLTEPTSKISTVSTKISADSIAPPNSVINSA